MAERGALPGRVTVVSDQVVILAVAFLAGAQRAIAIHFMQVRVERVGQLIRPQSSSHDFTPEVGLQPMPERRGVSPPFVDRSPARAPPLRAPSQPSLHDQPPPPTPH